MAEWFPEVPANLQLVEPHTLGWLKLSDLVWEKPNGDLFRFLPGQSQMVLIFRQDIPDDYDPAEDCDP